MISVTLPIAVMAVKTKSRLFQKFQSFSSPVVMATGALLTKLLNSLSVILNLI